MNEQGAHVITALCRSKLSVDKITAKKFLSQRLWSRTFLYIVKKTNSVSVVEQHGKTQTSDALRLDGVVAIIDVVYRTIVYKLFRQPEFTSASRDLPLITFLVMSVSLGFLIVAFDFTAHIACSQTNNARRVNHVDFIFRALMLYPEKNYLCNSVSSKINIIKYFTINAS